MVWKSLTTLTAHRSWKDLVQRLQLRLWKQSWHQAWEVCRVVEVSRQTLSSVSQSHQCVSPAQAELSLQGRGSCSPSVLLAGGSQMSVCLWDSSDLSVSHAQQYLTCFLLFLWGRGAVCSIQSATRSVGGITCMCRKWIVAVKWQKCLQPQD